MLNDSETCLTRNRMQIPVVSVVNLLKNEVLSLDQLGDRQALASSSGDDAPSGKHERGGHRIREDDGVDSHSA